MLHLTKETYIINKLLIITILVISIYFSTLSRLQGQPARGKFMEVAVLDLYATDNVTDSTFKFLGRVGGGIESYYFVTNKLALGTGGDILHVFKPSNTNLYYNLAMRYYLFGDGYLRFKTLNQGLSFEEFYVGMGINRHFEDHWFWEVSGDYIIQRKALGFKIGIGYDFN
ncbi:MAG: hypothetical protein IIA45_14790 [Bacteroidetes bacterium]|nr:hypothetical protein [Bacteroidota bacterium]